MYDSMAHGHVIACVESPCVRVTVYVEMYGL